MKKASALARKISVGLLLMKIEPAIQNRYLSPFAMILMLYFYHNWLWISTVDACLPTTSFLLSAGSFLSGLAKPLFEDA